MLHVELSLTVSVQGGPKSSATDSWPYGLSNLNRLKKTSLEDYLVNLQLNGYPVLKVPPHLACVATLPCETSVSAKQAINNKLQGRVTTI